ncbi:MAG: hypothetical protein V4675_19150 [Verrucomicrobiota bacterium]
MKKSTSKPPEKRKVPKGKASPKQATKKSSPTPSEPVSHSRSKTRVPRAETTGSSRPNEAFIAWALARLFGKDGPEDLQPTTLDLSHLDPDTRAARGYLCHHTILRGLHYDPAIESNPGLKAIERAALAMAMAGAESPYAILEGARKFFDMMVDLAVMGKRFHDPKCQHAGVVISKSLSMLVYRVQRFLQGTSQPDNSMDSLDRLWKDESFQENLRALRRHKKSDHPKRRFAEYICDYLIGYMNTNAGMSGVDLVLNGIVWNRPTTQEEFSQMRPILQAVSLNNLWRFAELLEEDGSVGQAKQVRALKSMRAKQLYYHEAQFDESFRSFFSLSKTRKKAAGKTQKP